MELSSLEGVHPGRRSQILFIDQCLHEISLEDRAIQYLQDPYLDPGKERAGNEESCEISVEEDILLMEDNGEDDDSGRWRSPVRYSAMTTTQGLLGKHCVVESTVLDSGSAVNIIDARALEAFQRSEPLEAGKGLSRILR